MRGDIIYCVYGVHEGREKNSYFGSFRTDQEARDSIKKLMTKEMQGGNWASQYHNKGFEVHEVVVNTDFEIPSRPTPRKKYCVKVSSKANRLGTWDSTIVEVLRRTTNPDGAEKICQYERSYAMLQTFEPFRQGNRDFALVSLDYTRTAVLDLATGIIIAEETESKFHFCPVGFYVPDWWDVNDDSIIPGCEYWSNDKEWPTSSFGFVWGCAWGDDSTWKVQYLDLSRIQYGVIRREERFGYLELATTDYKSPCLTLDPPTPNSSDKPDFITVSKYKGAMGVTFSVEMGFDLSSGKSEEWQRLKITNME